MSDISYEEYNKKSLIVRTDNKEKYQSLLKPLGARWNGRARDGQGWLVPLENEDKLKQVLSDIKRESETSETHTKSRKEQSKFHRAESVCSESDQSDEENNQTEQEDDEPINPIVVEMLKKQAGNKVISPKRDTPKVTSPRKATPVAPVSSPVRSPSPVQIDIEHEAIVAKREEERQRFEQEKRRYEAEKEREERDSARRAEKEKEAKRAEKQAMREKIARLEAEKEAKAEAKRVAKTKHKDPTTTYYKNFNKKPVDFRAMYGSSDEENNYSSSRDSASESSDDFPSPGTPQRRHKTYRKEEDHTELFEKVKELQRRMYEMELKNKRRDSQHKR